MQKTAEQKTAEQWQEEIDLFKLSTFVESEANLTTNQTRHLDWLIGRLLLAKGLATAL